MVSRAVSGLMSCLFLALGQQVPDAGFAPPIEKPAFAPGTGPRVVIDSEHLNFHTANGRYKPFAELLRRDGYRVTGMGKTFTAETFRNVDVLVVANALHVRNVREWTLPTPSAFTREEIDALVEWVRGGGALLLIADHMPFAGAAADLGKELGITFLNTYARAQGENSSVFTKRNGRLKEHAVTAGIDQVATFTGSAFRLERGGEALLEFDSSFESWEVTEASRFTEDTPRKPLLGWLQGAVMQVGKGRVAVFGEAAMFSAQLAGPNKAPMGMNHPKAAQNPLFLRNLMRWLSAVASDGSRVIR